jgi:hypothetical protein
MPVHIRLQRVPREDGIIIWKFSAASVVVIPDLYRRYGCRLFGEALPRLFNETDFLDTPLRGSGTVPALWGPSPPPSPARRGRRHSQYHPSHAPSQTDSGSVQSEGFKVPL